VRSSGIEKRGFLFGRGHPFYEQRTPPSITEAAAALRQRGVPLAAQAALKALDDARSSPDEITHLVCTTTGDASNPSFDLSLMKMLGMENNGVERVLMGGVGCAGGLATVRAAANLLLASRACRRRARILIVALEVASPYFNFWFQEAQSTQNISLPAALFGDGAAALIMGYDGAQQVAGSTFPYSLRAFTSWTVPETMDEVRGDVHPSGWTAYLSPKLPALAAVAVPPALQSLLEASGLSHLNPEECDWALHPGGAAIIKQVGERMGLKDDDQLRGSWGVYAKHGNSSSVTVLGVLQALRGGKHAADTLAGSKPSHGDKPKEWTVAVAYGFGLTIEMALFHNGGHLC
jgi:fungal type III polyketide synthase